MSALQVKDSLSHQGVQGLALAFSRADWIDAVDQEAIVETARRSIDSWVRRQAESSPSEIVDRGWQEHGHLGQAINLLAEPLNERGLLEGNISDHPDSPITRRKAYAQFLDAGIEWRSGELRDNYNQIVIVTMNILRANRGLEALESDLAREQSQIDHWIDQAIGIKPTSGRGAPHAETGSFHTATEVGITKEGAEYDMVYGPVGIRDTVTLAHETDLERVKERAKEMVEAFGHLRWFTKGGCDSGNRTIAQDGVISLRNFMHPGSAGYWRGYGGNPLFIANVLEDDISKRWAELAIEHGTIEIDDWRNEVRSLRHRIPQVEGYRAVSEMENSDYTVPMNRETDVWFDVDMGLVSVVDGDTQFMANIPQSASTNANDHGVNRRCMVHYKDPVEGNRMINADVRRLEYPHSGDTWTRTENLWWPSDFLSVGDWEPRTRYLPWRREKIELHNAMAGEELPQTAQINGESWPGANGERSGRPDPRVGMGIHYREMTIGPYLIGINSTGNEKRGFGSGREFQMQLPEGDGLNLQTNEKVSGETLSVPPRTGVVIKFENPI